MRIALTINTRTIILKLNNMSEHNRMNIITFSRLTLFVENETKSVVFELYIYFEVSTKVWIQIKK